MPKLQTKTTSMKTILQAHHVQLPSKPSYVLVISNWEEDVQWAKSIRRKLRCIQVSSSDGTITRINWEGKSDCNNRVMTFIARSVYNERLVQQLTNMTIRKSNAPPNVCTMINKVIGTS